MTPQEYYVGYKREQKRLAKLFNMSKKAVLEHFGPIYQEKARQLIQEHQERQKKV